MNVETKKKLYKMAGLDPKTADTQASAEHAANMAQQSVKRAEQVAKMRAAGIAA